MVLREAETQCQLLQSLKEKFSDRGLTILRLIRERQTNQRISRELAISERLLGYCLQGLYAKLGVNKRIDAVREATRLHLLDE